MLPSGERLRANALFRRVFAGGQSFADGHVVLHVQRLAPGGFNGQIRQIGFSTSKKIGNAVARNREVMGATNPAQADEGTIRKSYAESIEANSVHGSDSLDNARIEIDFFFTPEELVG